MYLFFFCISQTKKEIIFHSHKIIQTWRINFFKSCKKNNEKHQNICKSLLCSYQHTCAWWWKSLKQSNEFWETYIQVVVNHRATKEFHVWKENDQLKILIDENIHVLSDNPLQLQWANQLSRCKIKNLSFEFGCSPRIPRILIVISVCLAKYVLLSSLSDISFCLRYSMMSFKNSSRPPLISKIKMKVTKKQNVHNSSEW